MDFDGDTPNGDTPDAGEPFQPGEKVAAVLEAAHNLVMHHQPADRAGYLQLFMLRKLVNLAGGVDGALRVLPPLEDSLAWDGLLQVVIGILLELRGDDAEPVNLAAAQSAGALWLDALMSEASEGGA